jgi:thiopurine S-methyltransferase
LTEDWLGRWSAGRTGWHEENGNAGLKKHWPVLARGASVLVPLCGKSPDLLWLANKGYNVVGVEVSEVAIRAFFSENNLTFSAESGEGLKKYIAREVSVELIEGDYFSFNSRRFDALYDRGALVALPEAVRPLYVEHSKSLLKADALRFIVSLEYDQSVVAGPPFSVPGTELEKYWDDLKLVEEKDDLETCPPKFRAAGLAEISEKYWRSGPG